MSQIDITDYFPQSHYSGGIPGINSYSQGSLSNVYGQSYDLTQMSLGAYKGFLGEAKGITDKFRARVGIIEMQGERLKEDLLNAPSIVQAQVKSALDRNTKEQATLMASMQGPAARVNALLMSKNLDQAQMMASSGVAEFIKEDITRKSMYYQQLANNNQQVIQALGGLSQANMQGAQVATSAMTRGLQTALGAVQTQMNFQTKLMEQDIQQNQLQNEWNMALLDSQTNMAMNIADNMGGMQQAILDAQSMQYNSFVTADAKAYGEMKHAQVNLYKAELEDDSRRRIAAQQTEAMERLGNLGILHQHWQDKANLGMDFIRLHGAIGNKWDSDFNQLMGVLGSPTGGS